MYHYILNTVFKTIASNPKYVQWFKRRYCHYNFRDIWSSRFRHFWISIHVIDRWSKHGKQVFDKNSFIRYKLSWSWMMLQMSIFQEQENMFFDSYVHVRLWADNVCSLHFKNASFTVWVVLLSLSNKLHLFRDHLYLYLDMHLNPFCCSPIIGAMTLWWWLNMSAYSISMLPYHDWCQAWKVFHNLVNLASNYFINQSFSFKVTRYHVK